MTTTDLETKVHDSLAQKRIAVAGEWRNNSDHPTAILIYRRLNSTKYDAFSMNRMERIVRDCRAGSAAWRCTNPREGIECLARSSAVLSVTRYQRDAGTCPMICGAGVDFGDRSVRRIMRVTGGLPI